MLVTFTIWWIRSLMMLGCRSSRRGVTFRSTGVPASALGPRSWSRLLAWRMRWRSSPPMKWLPVCQTWSAGPSGLRYWSSLRWRPFLQLEWKLLLDQWWCLDLWSCLGSGSGSGWTSFVIPLLQRMRSRWRLRTSSPWMRWRSRSVFLLWWNRSPCPPSAVVLLFTGWLTVAAWAAGWWWIFRFCLLHSLWRSLWFWGGSGEPSHPEPEMSCGCFHGSNFGLLFWIHPLDFLGRSVGVTSRVSWLFWSWLEPKKITWTTWTTRSLGVWFGLFVVVFVILTTIILVGFGASEAASSLMCSTWTVHSSWMHLKIWPQSVASVQ